MKKYNSVTFKLFVILTLFLLSFVCILVYVQTFIVGRLYMTTNYAQEMENKLYGQLENTGFFAGYTYNHLYFSSDVNFKKYITEEIHSFENANKTYLVVFNKDFKIKYITDSAKNNLKDSYLSNISNHLSSKALNTKEFSSVDLKFSVFLMDKPILNTEKPKGIDKEYPYTLSTGPKDTFRVFDKLIPSKYIAVSTPILLDKQEINYIVIIMPEVFTDKSSLILKKYILYILIASIILILIISAIFSYLITKPIIKINKTASKMINLNFNEKCNIKSKDEIGNLSNSLNYLSSKLDDTLKELYSANIQLQKDLDFQRELDLLRKDFIASVSHEFKTPITLIKGYTESLKDNIALEEEKEGIYNIITCEADKMDRLIYDLLELCQMESTRYELTVEDFYIDALVENVIKKYDLILKEKNLYFEIFIEDKDILICGDSFKIEQVITNFLNNAILHTEKHKKIRLCLSKEEELMIFSIENEGKHIPEEDLKNIWEKFYRVDKSRNQKSGGTGLGLAICKVILDHHKARYGVENTLNGVKFYFILKCIVE